MSSQHKKEDRSHYTKFHFRQKLSLRVHVPTVKKIKRVWLVLALDFEKYLIYYVYVLFLLFIYDKYDKKVVKVATSSDCLHP